MKPKDLNERQTAFALALARLISDENSEREFAAMNNSSEFSILMDIATKLPADSEEFQLTTGLAAYHLYMAHELGEVPEHMRAQFESFFNKKAAHA